MLKTFNDPQLIELESGVNRFLDCIEERQTPRWLSLLGKSGTGKTHCAKWVWDWFKSLYEWNPTHCEYVPRLIRWPELVDQMRSGERFQEVRDMARWPMLVLDEIGAERDTTGFASEKLTALLCSRDRKWTVITGNITVATLASVDERIVSRMLRHNGIICDVNTVDFFSR